MTMIDSSPPKSSTSTTIMTTVDTSAPSVADQKAAPGTKKKPRYSRQQKRDRKGQRQDGNKQTSEGRNDGRGVEIEDQQQSLQGTRPPKPQKPRKTWQDRIFQCIRDAERTGAVVVEDEGSPPPEPVPNNDDSLNIYKTNQSLLDQIRVVTSCGSDAGRDLYPPTPGLTVRVKPLLILDLNGILCHRSRKQKEPQGVQLRQPFLGTVAGTPVVGRTDLISFLRLVDQHFCLAVWTSAKLKTARGLLKLLFPKDIERRLLFLWAQHDCHQVLPQENNDNNEVTDDAAEGSLQQGDLEGSTTPPPSPQIEKQVNRAKILFEKHLDKVWREYPLWNVNNTLLMDDSPEKCPFGLGNAIHPPPLHGQWRPPMPGSKPQFLDNQQKNPSHAWIPDEQNEQLQYQFFEQYIQQWQKYPFAEQLTESTVPALLSSARREAMAETATVREHMTNLCLYAFLRLHGTSHMGWRGGDRNDEEDNYYDGNTSTFNADCRPKLS